jgi:YhcH/YjgK/YiaL family protein
MIIDTLSNAGLYKSLGERIQTAFQYLRQTNFDALEKGKYEVDGDNVFAIVNDYETKDKSDCEVEAHRKYIDIQYMVKGTEMFGYAPLSQHVPVVDYDSEKDVAIYSEEMAYLKLEAGMFILFYPTDLHQPEVRQYEPVWVKKVVMKIKV